MTPFEPTLFVDRVRLFKNGSICFSGDFHEGLNIISGQNSSGKTSIMQLIAYGLGRDIKEQFWNDEQLSCDFIIIETLLNGDYYCLKRDIERSGRRPLDIFQGRLEAALEAGIEAWSKYPYNSTSEKQSFSDTLFKLLKIPTIYGESSKITMHQIMRLCYADQSTPAREIFTLEQWDTVLNRENIYRLITGFFSNSLFEAEAELRTKEKELDSVIAETKAITKILTKAGFEDISESFISNSMIALSNRESQVQKEIEKKLAEKKDKPSKISSEADEKYDKLNNLRQELEELKNTNNNLKIEHDDSLEFVQELQKRKSALKDSLKLRGAISDFDFDHCPSCFNTLENEIDEHHCKLCKKDLGKDGLNKNYLRMSQELDFQINESKRLIEKRRLKITENNRELRLKEKETKNLKNDIAILRKTIFTQEDTEIKELFVQLGNTRQEASELSKRKDLFSEIEVLRKNRDLLTTRISKLKELITAEKESIESRINKIEKTISDCCVDVLHNDLPRQEEFENAKTVSFSASSNRVYVDQKSQFSESSQVFLKNAFHIALLRASIKEPGMMFPRFLMLDGIENGGMEDIRSRKLQEFLSTISAGTDVPHQIIVSTAKISATLNNEKYTVGRFFTQEKKSIEIK